MIPQLSQVQECSYCNGAIPEHDDDCPMAKLEQLRQDQKFIECPKCQKPAVGLNKSDYYECRECNTQYTTGAYCASPVEDTPNTLFIDDDVYPVSVLVEKGRGNFPLDDRIKQLENKIEQLNQKKRKKRK